MRYFKFANRSSSGTRTVSGRELVSQEAEDARMCGRMEKRGVPLQNSLVSTIYLTTEEELANKREERLAKEN